MKAFVLSLSFLVCALSQSANNLGYQCNLNANWKSSQACIKEDPGNQYIVDIRPCVGVNQFCPANNAPGTTEVMCGAGSPYQPTPPSTQQGLPGDPCTTTAQCTNGGTCTLGYCVGKAAGGVCTTDKNCNPGLFCSGGKTSICTAQLVDGTVCARDAQCLPGSGCNNLVCRAFYSVGAAAVVSDCTAAGGVSSYPNMPMGSTGGAQYSVFCQGGTCDTDGKTCGATLKSVSAIPVACTQDTDCKTSNGATVSGNTQCIKGFNPKGTSYCMIEVGDGPNTNFMQWITGTLTPILRQNAQYCHTIYRGINIQCLLRIGGQYLVNQFQMQIKSAVNFPKYQNADQCTMQVFQSDYYGAQQYNDFCDTTFSCSNSTFTQNLSCLQETSGSTTISVRPCTDMLNPSCPAFNYYQPSVTNTYEVQCIPAAPAAAATYGPNPGDPCTANGQCLSNNCPYGVCVGVGGGSQCDYDTDCNPGFYCDTTNAKPVCTALLTAGSTTSCSRDAQCVMNAGCNTPQGGTSTCTTYYSVAATKTVSDCYMGGTTTTMLKGTGRWVYYSNFCASGTCEPITGGTAGQGTCVNAYSLSGGPSVSCNFGPVDCESSNGQGGSITYNQCQCSMQGGKKRMCTLDLGDAPFTQLMSWTNNYLSLVAATKVCHTTRRGFDPVCMMRYGGTQTMMNFTEAYQYATNYASIVSAPECTLPVYFPQYWTAYLYNNRVKPDNLNAAWVLTALSSFLLLAN